MIVVTVSTNVRYLQQFKTVAKNITFLAQNNLQADLLNQHFGEDIDTTVVGIDVSEVHEIRREAMSTEYDFVYHGSAVNAKGIGLVLRMARLLPARSFLVPADLEDVKQATQLETLPENLTCTSMNWTTGLSEACATCKVVLCPSVWSTPIEISLLKSIAINCCVAVINFSQNYSAELSEDCLIRLSPSIETDIHRLDDIVANNDLRTTLQTRAQHYRHGPRSGWRNTTSRLNKRCAKYSTYYLNNMPRTTRKIGLLCAFLLLAGCQNPTLLLTGKQLVGPTESVDSFAFAQQFSVLQLEVNPDQPYSVNLRVTVIDGNLYIDASKQRRWYRYLKKITRFALNLAV